MDDTLTFRLITRSLAVVCLMWAFFDCMQAGIDAMAMLHHLHQLQRPANNPEWLASEHYWVRYYGGYVLMHLLMILVCLFTARWLYRGGSRVRRFFGLDEQ